MEKELKVAVVEYLNNHGISNDTEGLALGNSKEVYTFLEQEMKFLEDMVGLGNHDLSYEQIDTYLARKDELETIINNIKNTRKGLVNMNTTFRESKVRKYTVKAVGVHVTEYNDAYEDWSGSFFAKAPFVLGHLALDGEITKEDIARLILKELYVFNYDMSLDDVMDSMEIYDSTIRISIIEDEDGFANDLGRYLVDYAISVEEIIEVDLENMKERS